MLFHLTNVLEKYSELVDIKCNTPLKYIVSSCLSITKSWINWRFRNIKFSSQIDNRLMVDNRTRLLLRSHFCLILQLLCFEKLYFTKLHRFLNSDATNSVVRPYPMCSNQWWGHTIIQSLRQIIFELYLSRMTSRIFL